MKNDLIVPTKFVVADTEITTLKYTKVPFKSIPLWRLQKYKKRVISLLYLEDLKIVYFSVAMAVYFWMVIYRI